jgi:hypothetical protein
MEAITMKKHTVKINIADRRGDQRRVLTSTRVSLPRRLLRFLFGDFCQVLVLTPGETVEGIEINETRRDGGPDE